MHPRSKQWHLSDYIFVKLDEVEEVRQARAMEGEDCLRDHHLIKVKLRIKIRHAASRRTQDPPKKINCMALKDDAHRKHYSDKVLSTLQENRTGQEILSVEEDWTPLLQQLLTRATQTLGLECEKQRD